eukprot:5830776-Prymnesium_polylepis.1
MQEADGAGFGPRPAFARVVDVRLRDRLRLREDLEPLPLPLFVARSGRRRLRRDHPQAERTGVAFERRLERHQRGELVA